LRFYHFDIRNATTGAAVLPSSLGGLPISSLLPNGQTNPAALNVELDIPVASLASPDGQAIVTIWGLGLQDIKTAWGLGLQVASAQGQQQEGALITIYGGMAKGLPLANPAQQGPLVIGQINQAFGNWIGIDQTVALILSPPSGTQAQPKNISFQWIAGQTLQAALQTTLSVAFPGVPLRFSISPKLVLAHTETHVAWSMEQLADLVMRLSLAISPTPNYQGVSVVNNGNNITINDYTTTPQPTAINFQDMVGQPTWIEPGVIQVKLVMRGDLALYDTIKLPPSLITTTADAYVAQSGYATFSGNYQIQRMHHYGNFRSNSAADWNTTIDCLAVSPDATTSASTDRPGVH